MWAHDLLHSSIFYPQCIAQITCHHSSYIPIFQMSRWLSLKFYNNMISWKIGKVWGKNEIDRMDQKVHKK